MKYERPLCKHLTTSLKEYLIKNEFDQMEKYGEYMKSRVEDNEKHAAHKWKMPPEIAQPPNLKSISMLFKINVPFIKKL